MVHDAGLAGDILGDRNALVLGLVGEHRPGDHVADRPDAGHLGAELVVGLDLAALVGLQPGLVEAEAFGVGPAADRDQHDVGLDRLGRAALRGLDGQRDRVALALGLGDLGRKPELEALLLEDLVGFLAHVAVEAGQDLVEELDDRDLRAEPPPDRAELEPDHAAADHDHALRHLRQLERAGGIDDPLLVDGDAGQRRDRRAGGDDDVLRADGAVADLDRVGALEASRGPSAIRPCSS